MIDIVVVGTVANIIWYVFTVVFVLYKFTTAFTYLYSLFKFCGTLISGIQYVASGIYNYSKRKLGFVTIGDAGHQYILPDTPANKMGWWGSTKQFCTKLYHKCYYNVVGKHHPQSQESMYVPLQETHIHRNHNIAYGDISSHKMPFTNDYSSLLPKTIIQSSTNNEDVSDSQFIQAVKNEQCILDSHTSTSSNRKPDLPFSLTNCLINDSNNTF